LRRGAKIEVNWTENSQALGRQKRGKLKTGRKPTLKANPPTRLSYLGEKAKKNCQSGK